MAWEESCYDPFNDDDETFVDSMEGILNLKISIELKKRAKQPVAGGDADDAPVHRGAGRCGDAEPVKLGAVPAICVRVAIKRPAQFTMDVSPRKKATDVDVSVTAAATTFDDQGTEVPLAPGDSRTRSRSRPRASRRARRRTS
jgi:hypothetical protein